ncbi:MAG: T9SS type A sorting domain-containing protein [Ignavibacteriales bacterium]|nr:MAG: T9SS type A sorting domain-containing protein [Ignavibacteriales bacterium]
MNKLLFFCILIVLLPAYIHSQTEPVDTDSDGKKEVSTLSHLLWISTNSSGWSYSYEQTANIDASVTSGWNGGEGFLPIGNSYPYFTGIYDGQGFTISNLTINRSSSYNIGMFGIVSGGTIKNLGLESIYSYGKGTTGALVGYGSDMTVQNCFSTGLVRCEYDKAGGLIGENYYGSCSVTNSYSSATVQGAYAGSNSSYAGGFIGNNNSGSISQCYSTGPVSGKVYTGGFAGANLAGSITNCYSRGSVNGLDASGFVDANRTTLSNCYSTGAVSGTTPAGFVRDNTSTVSNCFWDKTTSGQTSSAAGTGLLTADMKTQSTFLNADWSPEIWNMDSRNDGYPYLDWENPGGSPLPVELVSFSARANGDDIILSWMTATEVDNYGFEIERIFSESGEFDNPTEIWESAGFVGGNGNCNSPRSYSFADKNMKTGFYQYRLKQIDTDGSYEYSSAVLVRFNNIPVRYSLDQNYPNPFNPETVIGFALPERSFISLEIFSVSGEKIAVIASGEYDAGRHKIKADASGLPSGIYMYVLRYGGNTLLSRKMAVVR